MLALGLSLFGVILGVFLRIRAFLYGGLIFLILNVGGQLIRFYPEGRLEKGIVLVVLGTVIMALMIWFNIQKEMILKRIRIFRADLESWD
jgi:hypothetical protein